MSKPPNLRDAECCYTCKFHEEDSYIYDGYVVCTIYQDESGILRTHRNMTDVCDDYEVKE